MSEVNRPDRSKPTRTPLGARNVLTFRGLEKGFTYRIINDQDDRLVRAQEAGYEFVTSDEKLGDKKVAEATKIGSKVQKQVGGGVTGYLMRIKDEWYQEDQESKQAKISSMENAMKPNKAKDEYGSGLTNE